MRDREKIREVFDWGDKYIKENPEVFESSLDEIFEELNDGTKEMMHMRWAVMTRVSMKNVERFDYIGIVNYLKSIKDKNLMFEYIGYILQEEYEISLIRVMITAFEMGIVDAVLPTVIPNIPYERDFQDEEFEVVLKILDNQKENTVISQLLINYSILIVKEQKEKHIIEEYCIEENQMFEKLMYYLGYEIYNKEISLGNGFVGELLKEEKPWCSRTAIEFLGISVKYDNVGFEKYFEEMEKLCENSEEYWSGLIPVYINYLELPEGLFRDRVSRRLLNVKDSNIEQKRIFSRTISYKKLSSEEAKRVLEDFLKVSFNKDKIVLNGIDYVLSKKVKKNIADGIKTLLDIFRINYFSIDDDFLESLEQVCSELIKDQDYILKYVFDGIVNGDQQEFAFAMQLYKKVLDISKAEAYFENSDYSEEQYINILKAVLYFTIEPKKICLLAFVMLVNMKTTERYYEVCQKEIYKNYPVTMIDIANKFKTKDNLNQRKIAEALIECNDVYLQAIGLVYADKDFRPSLERTYIYRRAQRESSKRINEKVNKNSIVGQLFSSCKMKCGKRFAFVRNIGKNNFSYQVSNYGEHKFELELPKQYMKKPLELNRLRQEYLQKRRKNAINN